MQNTVAFANNDVITIAWSYGRKPENCMGFAIYRLQNGKEEPLPSHAVFPGETIKPGQTTEQFPVQKFYWKDLYARMIAEKDGGSNKFRYKIVPLEGTPGKLTPMTDYPQLITNEIEITPTISDKIQAYFNRGLISTQRVSEAMAGNPSKTKLLAQVGDPKSDLRQSLTGDMLGALTGFVARAKDEGSIYAGLYELGDAELLQSLVKMKDRLHIVLSNSIEKETDQDTGEKAVKDGNQASRDALDATGCEKHDRIFKPGQIGHNKFAIYVDGKDQPKAVLFGSTNWTPTGLCTQTNNTIIIDDEALAKRYMKYWKQLADDTDAAAGDPKSLQGKDLRSWDTKKGKLALEDGVTLESWYSPNTPKLRSGKPGKSETCPPDMAQVKDVISRAKKAILFLAFNPGTPSIADWIAQAAQANQDLFIRGCVTSPDTAGEFYYELKGTQKPKKVKGQKTPVPTDPRVLFAQALDKQIPEGWKKELLNAGFAIIHDKIVVIDPFDEDCVVITGSHNLGYRASYNNDENLAIISGQKKLAAAYTTHVLDVYDHFSFRYKVNNPTKDKVDVNLKVTPDDWLAKYYNADGEVINSQLKFWLSSVSA